MDDSLCSRFFLEPTDTLHRQYEALRAVFVEQRPMQEAAQQFGYRYDTMRALVSRFRRQCETEQLPPFLPGRNGDGPPADSRANPRPPRKRPCYRSTRSSSGIVSST